jgi:3-hydroxyacyl-[acyl-carrier-protein] dehydratase
MAASARIAPPFDRINAAMDTESTHVAGFEIDIQRVQRMIPHRYPFLMIDKVIDVVPDVRATGIKNVTINEPHFVGHFPADPVMPGVLLIEAMAQTAAVLVVATLGPEREGSLVYFMSVDQARFRKPVGPGDTLAVHVSKERKRGNVWKFKGRAMVGNTLVAEATYTAMIRDL